MQRQALGRVAHGITTRDASWTLDMGLVEERGQNCRFGQHPDFMMGGEGERIRGEEVGKEQVQGHSEQHFTYVAAP